MYRQHKNSNSYNIQDIVVNVPPVGMVYNIMTKQWEKREIFKRSSRKENQFWERPQPPQDYELKRKKEMATQKTTPAYFNPELQTYRNKEWDRRLNGFWFYNNGNPTYITGLHYFYLTHWKIDVGYPSFRIPDMEFFYFLEYTIQDPRSLGMIEVTKRRQGKTMRAGAFLYELTSRSKNKNAGIQSKTFEDAKDNVFAKGVVMPFKYLPDFFVPIYDTEKGKTPKGELRFFKTNKRGAVEDVFENKVELESMITFKSADKFAYDGQKLHRYLADECGKCFGYGTKIRMFDGSVKEVQDIKNGEFVMGNDSTPRMVSGVTFGQEELFEIIPNKGQGFVCNISHILSLSVSDRVYVNGVKYKSGDIINISVKDYLNIPENKRNCFTIYSNGFDLLEKQHDIDPYFLGLWLGDGSSRDTSITNIDKEITDYIYDYANKLSLSVTKYSDITYGISSLSKKQGSNILRNFLKENNLFGNKHIPEDYIKDSIANRLKLLAGLIDTDGSAVNRKGITSAYEIIQKNKTLAYQIYQIALSCGFYASINNKIATMNRADGTKYKCEVYRVFIYGDIDKIPVLVERKKAIVSRTKNRRNPLKRGFIINSIGLGDYYGFEVDKNHLFLLEDGTVVHNTKNVDVYERHQVVQFCLMQEESIIGKALYTTTVEEMEDGGEAFKKLWDASNQNHRDGNGRTQSGLYRYFMPAYRTLYYDKYGFADETQGRNYYDNARKALEDDPRALASFIRKNPYTIEEAFFSEADSCLYDAMKLNRQLESITWISEKELYLQGEFMWEGGIRDSRVIFKESSNGKFLVLKDVNPSDHLSYNQVKEFGTKKAPLDKNKFKIGCDPFDHSITISNKRSDGAAYVYRAFDALDNLSETFVVEYLNRPDKAEIFYEDMIKLCHFFGCEILPEDNKVGLIKYFEYRGYERFLHRVGKKYGVSASTKVHQQIAELTESYIEENIHKVKFKNLILDWLKFNINKTTDFDAAMASGYTLMLANENRFKTEVKNDDKKIYEIRDLFPF